MCMVTLHTKSHCCRAVVVQHGKRRRQCKSCKQTWSIRQKRRGRKPVRVHPTVETIALSSHETLRHRAKRLHKGRETIRRRHARNLEMLYRKLPQPEAPPQKLIAVIDGKAFRFGTEEYTVYLIALRSVHGTYACVMEPVFLPGHESTAGWNIAFDALSVSIRRRIYAVVVDGIVSLERIAKERGWKLQRCHFHLIKTLQSLRGKRWARVRQKQLRENMYQLIREALRTSDEDRAQKIRLHIQQLVADPRCPRWYGLKVRGFLKRFDRFRTYRHAPELRLPTTTNTVETVCNRIADTVQQTRGFRTPTSCKRWLTVLIRTLPLVKCNGANSPQK